MRRTHHYTVGAASRRERPQTRHRQTKDNNIAWHRIRAGLKIDLDKTHARQRAGLHVFDAWSQREHAFELAGDVILHLFRRHP